MKALYDVIFSSAVYSHYGEVGFTDFLFEVELPDFSEDVDNRIELVPSWTKY